MAFTLEDLFAAGAHHTVESVLEQGGGVEEARDALTRRFGPLGPDSAMAVDELIREVGYSVQTARNIPFQQIPSVQNYGRNPAIPDDYQYIVVGSLPNPMNADETISVPWTINSSRPLTYMEILTVAQEELNRGYERDQRYMSANYADMHRRDIAFQRAVRDEYGGEAPIDVQVIGAYRHG